eukprot:15312280-Alexandrium_andersonii.AAC.1
MELVIPGPLGHTRPRDSKEHPSAASGVARSSCRAVPPLASHAPPMLLAVVPGGPLDWFEEGMVSRGKMGCNRRGRTGFSRANSKGLRGWRIGGLRIGSSLLCGFATSDPLEPRFHWRIRN